MNDLILDEKPLTAEEEQKLLNSTSEKEVDDLFGFNGEQTDALRQAGLRQKETFLHRVIALLYAQGLSPKKVFESLGGQWVKGIGPINGTGKISYQTIVNLKQVPWFRQKILKEVEALGLDPVKQMLQGEVIPSLEKLVEVRDSPESKKSEALAAANSILDRFLGKPTQHVESHTKISYQDVEKQREQLLEKKNRLAQELGFIPSSN